jgi:selenocysteine-specific elongation factor
MMPPIKSLVIGTAGHIDHGKTALIRALSGIDADRLPEEKRRGITIDLGFAFLNAASSGRRPLRISFVDVPGHSLFVHNMLAGAGCIAAVLLVVSAQEGIKPQTEEHLTICSLLGIRSGLAVITKNDAVEEDRLAQVQTEVRDFLRGTFLDPGQSEILTVSATTGNHIAELRRELIRLVERSPDKEFDHLPRLPIDRAFVMKGFGTVVTGTLLAGSLRTGQTLVLAPGGQVVRVRSLQSHGLAEDIAHAGSRVALNLGGVEVSDVSRGQTLVVPGTLTALTVIDVDARLLPGASGLKHGSVVHFHAFTSNTLARVLLYGRGRFEAGTERLMRLKLQTPVVLVAGDPFVLRQVSPATTIGGGRVLDAYPLQKIRKPETMAWLETLPGVSAEEQLFLRVARRGREGLSIQRLLAETGLSREAAEHLWQSLVNNHRLHPIPGDILLANQALEAAGEAICALLKKQTSGLKRSEIKSRTSLGREILDFALERLVRAAVVRIHGELVYPIEAGSPAPSSDNATRDAIAEIYRKAGLSAPLIAEVAVLLRCKESELRGPVTTLLREKSLVRMGSDSLFIHQEPLARLRALISELRGQTVDVASFKQLTGLSRKYAIPLLEYLDREHITRKMGDQRLVL